MTDTTVPQGNDRLAAAMAEVKRLDPLDLLALYYLVQAALTAAEFPALIVGSRVVTDDGETYTQQYLECPHCHRHIGDDNEEQVNLIAVDIAERWEAWAGLDFDDRTVSWTYDSSADFEGLLYKCGECNKPVRLPENWSER